MKNKRIITSLDQVMRFLNVEYDPNLPCPRSYPEKAISHYRPLVCEANMRFSDEMPKVDGLFQELVYRKEKLSFDLKDLYFWERIK